MFMKKKSMNMSVPKFMATSVMPNLYPKNICMNIFWQFMIRKKKKQIKSTNVVYVKWVFHRKKLWINIFG